MATARHFPLSDNVNEGADCTSPAHLIGQKWRTMHNMRLTPQLEQIPNKVILGALPAEQSNFLGYVPSNQPGAGTLVVASGAGVYRVESDFNITQLAALTYPTDAFFRFSPLLYSGWLYLASEFGGIIETDGTTAWKMNTPAFRYIATWYDHMVGGWTQENPNRFCISALHDFTDWTPDRAKNEADYYDLVEWEQPDYPFRGITGFGKLKGLMWVYTPTAIIPFQYVGRPKVINLLEQGVLSRIGNTYPYTLACLDNVHFFYDGLERMFFAFDGQQVQPIGEPIRRFIDDNINTDIELASRMYSYVDVDNREVWWVFISNKTTDPYYDMAVVFNYRLKKWYTADVAGVSAFIRGVNVATGVGSLAGTIAELTGTIMYLGKSSPKASRLYCVNGGYFAGIARDETPDDADSDLLVMHVPTLETGDKHYGDIRVTKENDGVIVNATYQAAGDQVAMPSSLDVYVAARNYLANPVDSWGTAKGGWKPDLQDGMLCYQSVAGRVFRYKFVGTNLRNLKFSAYSEAVLTKQAEK